MTQCVDDHPDPIEMGQSEKEQVSRLRADKYSVISMIKSCGGDRIANRLKLVHVSR